MEALQGSMHQRRLLDWAITLLALLIGAISLYALSHDRALFNWILGYENNHTTVAKIHSTQGSVQQRFASEFFWMPVAPTNALHNRDRIFTSDNADCEILFTNGTRVKLGPYTLVTILEGGIDVGFGNIELSVPDGEAFKVRKNNMALRPQKDSRTFSQVHDQFQEQTLPAQEIVIEPPPPPEPVFLRAPKVPKRQIFKSSDASSDVENFLRQIWNWLIPQAEAAKKEGPTLQWEAIEGADHYELEIAKDQEFKKILYKFNAKNPKLQWVSYKNYGRYYWRVRAVDKDQVQGEMSNISTLDIQKIIPSVKPKQSPETVVETKPEVIPEVVPEVMPKALPQIVQSPKIKNPRYAIHRMGEVNLWGSALQTTDGDNLIATQANGLFWPGHLPSLRAEKNFLKHVGIGLDYYTILSAPTSLASTQYQIQPKYLISDSIWTRQKSYGVQLTYLGITEPFAGDLMAGGVFYGQIFKIKFLPFVFQWFDVDANYFFLSPQAKLTSISAYDVNSRVKLFLSLNSYVLIGGVFRNYSYRWGTSYDVSSSDFIANAGLGWVF